MFSEEGSDIACVQDTKAINTAKKHKASTYIDTPRRYILQQPNW